MAKSKPLLRANSDYDQHVYKTTNWQHGLGLLPFANQALGKMNACYDNAMQKSFVD